MRPSRSLLLTAVLALAMLRGAFAGEPEPELWVLDDRSAAAAEQTLAATLQGQLAKRGVLVWRREGLRSNQLMLERLKDRGARTHSVADVWQLLEEHHTSLRGYVLFRAGDSSINAATSLCSVLDAVAVDESIEHRVRGAGLRRLADARGQDEADILAQHPDGFSDRVAVVLDERIAGRVRDWAVSEDAFCFYGFSPEDRRQTLRRLGPSPTVYGWEGERGFVEDVSRVGGMVVPADYCLNLSVLARLPCEFTRPKTAKPEPVRTGERIVAFVMTDGDNLQFMSRGFLTGRGYWASPRRGQFAMTWELPPVAAEAAPEVLRFLYETASPRDGFVTGPSGAGYVFPHFHPDPVAFADRTAALITKCGLSAVTVLNAGGVMDDAKPLLARPEVLGVLYKGWDYASEQGRIVWEQGKPIASYRYVLWDGDPAKSPRGVAEAISRLPADPLHDQASYALVNVHAWSFDEIGGPMEAVHRCVRQLPPGVRVVTAEQLLMLLRENFGAPVPPQ